MEHFELTPNRWTSLKIDPDYWDDGTGLMRIDITEPEDDEGGGGDAGYYLSREEAKLMRDYLNRVLGE